MVVLFKSASIVLKFLAASAWPYGEVLCTSCQCLSIHRLVQGELGCGAGIGSAPNPLLWLFEGTGQGTKPSQVPENDVQAKF